MLDVDRTFKAKDRFGADMEFELVPPTLGAETEGERQYKIAYNLALSEGIFPRESLRNIMKKRDMWTEEDEKEYKQTIAQIALLQIELDKAEKQGDEAGCETFARKMADQRNRMWELFLIQQSVFMNSAEGIAEMVKAEAIMAACTRIKATGQRYWDNYKDFVIERDENEKSTVYLNVVGVQNKILDALRVSIEGQYPESKYIKDARESFIDREVAEEVEAQLLQKKTEEKPKPKRKTARKVSKKRGKVASKAKKPT